MIFYSMKIDKSVSTSQIDILSLAYAGLINSK